MPVNARVLRLAAAVFAAVANITCSDLLTAPEVGDVTLSFTGDTTIVLGAGMRPTISAALAGGAPIDTRVAFTSSDTTIVAVRGDSLIGKTRGEALITVTIASAVVPQDGPRAEQRVRVVIDTLIPDSTSVLFESLGDTVTLHAIALDAKDNTVTVPIRWSSSAPDVVRVDSLTGRLLAVAEGSAELRATVDFDTVRVPVTVLQELEEYTFFPAALVADALGLEQQPVAIPRDGRGNPIVRAGLQPTWSIDDASRALLDPSTGAIVSLLNGSTWIRATRGDVSDSLPYTVAQKAAIAVIYPIPRPTLTALGEQAQLTVRAFDRNAQELQTPFTPAWFTLTPGQIRTDAAGVVTALAPGTAQVIAIVDVALDTATIVVRNDAVDLIVDPDSATATSVGDTLVFSATVLNKLGDAIGGAAISWRSTDSSIVEVFADGRAVTRRTGTARVIAQSGTPVDTGVAVVRNEIADIDIVPSARALLSLGAVDTPVVNITNARGATLARGSVAWSVDDSFIARVNALGHVTALDTGQTYVRAKSGVLEDSVLYVVQNVPTSITIGGRILDTLTSLGQTLTYTVDIRNGRNAVIANYPVVWTTTDANQIIVDTAGGVATATAVGFGAGVALIATAGPVADTVYVVPRNTTRLYVDNGTVVIGSRVGTLARPFAKIQDAVMAADATDTVVIKPTATRYAETVSLTKRLTLLGDSTAFVLTGRNPAFLPTIAHDTGTAAIRIITSAPQTIRYLAIRHTLDGAAIDADGADLTIEWVYVNPPGSVTSRIGRGIAIRNSPSGTSVKNTRIRDVRGYGIRLENVLGAAISFDSIVGVDSIPGSEPGAAIAVIGGGLDTVRSNTLRSMQGPGVLLRGTSAADIAFNNIAGGAALWIENGDASSRFRFNYVNRRFAGSTPAIRLRALPSGTGPIIHDNVFEDSTLFGGGTVAQIDTARGWRFEDNRYRGVGTIYRTRDAVGISFGNRADTTGTFLDVYGSDTVFLTSDTIRCRSNDCVRVNGNGASIVPRINVSAQMDCARCITWISGTGELALGGLIRVNSSASVNSGTALYFEGSCYVTGCTGVGPPRLFMSFARFEGPDSPSAAPFSDPADSWNSAIWVRTASFEWYNTTITGFRRWFSAVYFVGNLGVNSGWFEGVTFTRNRRAIAIFANTSISAYPFATPVGANIFDNDVAGIAYDCSESHVGNCPTPPSYTLPNAFWWGDARGPRRDASLLATGDSIGGSNISYSSMGAPIATGSAPTAVRMVRGDNQTALAGTTASKALTVRVVDANGLPVPSARVTFTVTSGGGNFGGSSSVDLVTNGDGLAEVNFTTGTPASSNIVTVTGTSTAIGAVVFTIRGT